MHLIAHRPDLKSPPFYYILTLSALSLLLVFLVPPFQSPDEQTHLYRAYQLTKGTLIAKKLSYGAGDILPASLSASFNSFQYLMFQPEIKVNISQYNNALKEPLDSRRVTETRFENTAPYPPLAYIPQIIGISIGKIFSANPVVLLYLARFANAATWIVLIWLCMRRQSRIALALFAFALLPIVLFQSASASADVMTAGVAIFLSLELLRVATKKSLITRSDMVTLLVAGGVLALCKLPYVLLVLIVFAIPARQFTSLKTSWQFKLIASIIPFLLALLWILISSRSFVNLREIADTPAQLSFILHQPLRYAITLFNTYFTGSSDGLYVQMIGQLGWLDTKLTFWNLLLAFGAVLLATIGVIETKDYKLPSLEMRIIATTVLGLTITAISTLLYLTWNAPQARIIDGIQGRYFIPLIGGIIIALVGLLQLNVSQRKNITLIVYTMLTLSTIATTISLTSRYYAL